VSDDETEAEAPEPASAADEPEEPPETVPDDWLDQKPFDPAGR
jgi:hypothetical protein